MVTSTRSGDIRGAVSAPAARTRPLVSVVIPSYQAASTIEGAIRSALRQTYTALEVIVVDDGSTDATAAVLASIEDARLIVLSQANAGTAAARNRALARASGTYVAFLDSDDRWFPEHVERCIETLEAAREPIAIAYSGYYPVDDFGRLLNVAPVQTHRGSALDLLLDGENFLYPSVCVFDRRIFDEVGTFLADRYNEDYEYLIRASRHYPIVPTGDRLVVYRQSESGKCRRILADFDGAFAADTAVFTDLGFPLTAEQTRRLRENTYRSLYCRFLMYGFPESARRIEHLVEMDRLAATKKGLLGWIFAKTGLNLMAAARIAVQAYSLRTRQTQWKRQLAAAGMELRYD